MIFSDVKLEGEEVFVFATIKDLCVEHNELVCDFVNERNQESIEQANLIKFDILINLYNIARTKNKNGMLWRLKNDCVDNHILKNEVINYNVIYNTYINAKWVFVHNSGN